MALLLGQENVTEGQDPPVLQPSFNSAPERPLKATGQSRTEGRVELDPPSTLVLLG